jgi:hypothetical protein
MKSHNQIRGIKTALNCLGALAIVSYGYFCVHVDLFYIPPYWGERSIHGLSCWLMVGSLDCIALLLVLEAIRFYLKPRHRQFYEKVFWPIAYFALTLFAAALLVGWFLTPRN